MATEPDSVSITPAPDGAGGLMYLTVKHEVAPAEEGRGHDDVCGDCHPGVVVDWAELGRDGLGWDGDPIRGGTGP
jgi:hypothetical protein